GRLDLGAATGTLSARQPLHLRARGGDGVLLLAHLTLDLGALPVVPGGLQLALLDPRTDRGDRGLEPTPPHYRLLTGEGDAHLEVPQDRPHELSFGTKHPLALDALLPALIGQPQDAAREALIILAVLKPAGPVAGLWAEVTWVGLGAHRDLRSAARRRGC